MNSFNISFKFYNPTEASSLVQKIQSAPEGFAVCAANIFRSRRPPQKSGPSSENKKQK